MRLYQYEAPPEPEAPPSDVLRIEVPEEEGTPCTVLVHENGMTTYLHRARWDRTGAERMAAAINDWLTQTDEAYLGFRHAQYADFPVWVPRWTLLHLLNIHDATVMSPLAQPRMGGKTIVVPMGDGAAEIARHGPGKRRR